MTLLYQFKKIGIEQRKMTAIQKTTIQTTLTTRLFEIENILSKIKYA